MSDKTTNYTGWVKWFPNLDELSQLMTDPDYVPMFSSELKENEYVLAYTKVDDKDVLCGQYVWEDGHLKKFGRSSISWNFSKFRSNAKDRSEVNLSKKTSYTITPLNDIQVAAFHLMNNDKITFKMLSGNFGSGKTLLTCAKAIEMLLSEKVEKIVWIRNVVKARGTESLGYLPGDLWSKIRPWIAPLIDNLKSESAVLHMIENNQLEIVELDKIRGRSIDNAVIISTESQNLTEDLLRLVVGRVGKGSYLFLEGDFRQVDRDIFEKSQGMKAAIRDLAGEKLFGYVDLPIDERSETARLADKIGANTTE